MRPTRLSKSLFALLVAISAATHLAKAYYLSADPVIAPFAFDQNVQENQRSSVLCTISSGDLPVTISWLKDGQLLTPNLALAKQITIKPDSDQSTLKFNKVRLDHAGNYTCVAKNRAGIQAHSAQLIVRGAPRWLREPHNEPIVATRDQTIVIDCQTTGWPKPQQIWQMKTHTQSKFEPLAATGRISLAANGSLVIRNADKSDEANYLCKSSNGIGEGIEHSTSLKVTVPAHFESNKQQTSFVRKQNQVQLRCDAYGDEPITIEWFKNKQRLTNELDTRYTIHNKPLQNGLISLLLIKQAQRQDNSVYECLTRNSVGKDRLSIELLVQEEPDNIQELQATQINSRSATLMWTEPYDGRSAITSYMFQYKKVQEAVVLGASLMNEMDFMEADLSSSMLNQQQQQQQQQQAKLQPTSASADDWQQASRIMLPVSNSSATGGATGGSTGSIKSVTIERLEPASRYVLRALAINAIGQSKFSQPMEFVTEEEVPGVGPTNIRASAINSTSIQVSWEELPKSKQLGRIHGYYIGYRLANSSGQNFLYKPYIINDLLLQQQQQQGRLESLGGQRLETVIHELRRDTSYEITVVAFNSRGSGPSSDMVLCRTIEMEAPKPVKLQIRRETNESIFLEWKRDPSDQNPVDDYVLYQEKNSASQQWLQVRLPGNQTHFKAPGLRCGIRYQFYIIAHNKVGKSLPSEVVSASTSGAPPVIPSKTSLIKMVNSTCLAVNLNSFQDNGCRIKTFTVRYRVERTADSQHQSGSTSGVSANSAAASQLVGAGGLAVQHQALIASGLSAQGGAKAATLSGLSGQPTTQHPEWITIRPKSNLKQQRFNEEDRVEYLCDLSPVGEYTIYVAASNDVGHSEIEYTVLMSSDELRHSIMRDLLESLSQLPNIFAYIPTILVFLLGGLFLSLVSMFLYTSAIKYYQKFVIMHNQIRATKRAKQDEKRRRKLNNSRHSQKQLDLWADEYEEEECDDGDDEDDDDADSSTSNGGASANSANMMAPASHRSRHLQHRHFAANLPSAQGHYISNIANSAFDTSSIDTSACNNKFSGGSCMSTASTDSMHGRFQCLNSKQYVKMNDYTMLPSISASLSPPTNDIYGTTMAGPIGSRLNATPPTGNTSTTNQNSLYYSTLRRSNMQTYLPPQRQAQQQHLARRSQNISDIYGYYMAPQVAQSSQHQQQQVSANIAIATSQAQQQAANEAANSIFVPPQQIIYSAPNIKRQPVFL